MKAAAKLLAELAAQNITPVSTNEKLALRGAPDRITSEIVVRVREHKADLLAHLIQKMVRRTFGEWTVETVEIIRSELSPEGARYTNLASIPL